VTTQPEQNTHSLSFHQRKLDNGLEIIGEHNPNAKTFAAGYFVKTGSRDETDDISGVSHFLEHMMFKGTERRTAEDINREFDELGANYNAFTSEEQTVYYGAVIADRSAALLDLLSDMVRPSLRQEDFDMEKNVILEEIAMYDDRPNFKVFDQAREHYFSQHTLGNSVLGTTESITALERDQMMQYFEKRYAANNMILCISGNYDWATVQSQIEQVTTTWKSQESERYYPASGGVIGQHSSSEERLHRLHVAVYAPGVSAQSDERYAASILAYCIGGGHGSRIHWALIDKGLVDSASLWHSASDQHGDFSAYLSMEPTKYDEVMEIFRNCLRDVQDKGITSEEWQRAQRKFATGITLGGETPFSRLMSFGRAYQYRQEYMSVKKTVDLVKSTSLADGLQLLESRPFDDLFEYVLKPAELKPV